MTAQPLTDHSAGPGPHDRPAAVRSRSSTAARLFAGAVGLWALLSVAGLLVTHLSGAGRFHRWDLGVDTWFVHHRSHLWNTVTVFGSGVANTQTAVAVTAVSMLLLRWRLGRWSESWLVLAAIAGELVVFLAVTATVHRPRPPVPRLDVAPPTSSFPSGHTAAAVALYGCLAVVLLRTGARRRTNALVAAGLLALPVLVGFSRLYRGMHYPSDVVVGAAGGALWLLVVVLTLRPVDPRPPLDVGPVRTGTGARR